MEEYNKQQNYGPPPYGGDSGYCPPPPAMNPGYCPPPPPTTVIYQTGNCPACRQGILSSNVTCLGVCCAIFLFPIGLVCQYYDITDDYSLNRFIYKAKPLSIKRVLDVIDYPQLHSLLFVNFPSKILSQHLADETILSIINRITNITVGIDTQETETYNEDEANIFELILLHSKCLNDLTFRKSSREYQISPSVNIPNRKYLSSSLSKLNIEVNTFDDCLYLLNGCLPSLSTLIIYICKIYYSRLRIDNTTKLCKLKCFSLSTERYTTSFDRHIVPLLQRMLYLEELTLFLPVIRHKSRYIDGNQLYDEVLSYMPRLNQFIFSIHTHMTTKFTTTITELQSNSDMRKSFIKHGFQSFDTCSDDEIIGHTANCYVYSLPYRFKYFLYLGACFQGGKFDNVRFLYMTDKVSFGHRLFKIISEDFPFLKKLIIFNYSEQEDKPLHSSTLIIFNHLIELNLSCAHSDYIMQFLADKITRLPSLTRLEVSYEKLLTLTNYFTDDVARLNCQKISNNELNSLPTTLRQCIKLNDIDVSYNAIQSLSALEGLPSLKFLFTTNCQIKKIPRNLPTIKYFLSSKNNIDSLDGVNTLNTQSTKEKTFNFHRNKITKEIKQIKTLENFHLSYNQLKDVPEEIYSIQCLDFLAIYANLFTTEQLNN
ncbi:hypothetical protein I4U23_021665 [Adineta vaga]|nr:hypothetical protein I4U23_021665 [Adineta vaga]